MDPNAPRGQRQQALAVYVEPLAVGKRVAVLGDASLDLGATLAGLGARSVFVWDPDTDRARRQAERAPRGVIVRPLSGADLGVSHGPFDLVVVPDLEMFEDPEEILIGVRRWVGDDGVALVASPSRDAEADEAGFDYYELFDLVAGQFEDVTMIALLPFHGITLAELGADDDVAPDVTVDTQLAGTDRTPEGFVALASQRGVRLDPYAIVELAEALPSSEPSPDVDAMDGELAQARLRVGALEEHVEQLRMRLAEAEQGARRTQRLEAELRDQSSRTAEVETALADRSLRVAMLSEEIDRLRALEATDRMVAAQLEELTVRAERAERAASASEPELARVSESHAAELARYEETLRERARAARLLEAEIARRERMVTDLVAALEEAAQAPQTPAGPRAAVGPTPADSAPPPDVLLDENARLRQTLDNLSLELARREGEAQASAWTIAELERRLEVAARPHPPPSAHQPPAALSGDRADPEVEKRLASALGELDVLRQALAQEHEARVRAEHTAAGSAVEGGQS